MNHTLTVGTDLNDRRITSSIPGTTEIRALKYIAKVNDDNYIAEDSMVVDGLECSCVYYHYLDENGDGITQIFYKKYVNDADVNLSEFTLPENFGVVTEVDTTAICYEYLTRGCHEKVYVMCEDFCKEESLTKGQIIDQVEGYCVPSDSVIGWPDDQAIPEGYEETTETFGGGGSELIGVVKAYTGDTVPEGKGYLICDGSAISRTEYSDLFAITGTKFGAGDGSTTFNLPDLKGKVIVGLDVLDTDFNLVGKTGGSKYIQAHTHSQSLEWADSAGDYGYTNVIQFSGAKRGGTATITAGDVSGVTTGNSGNLQPYITMNYIIKAYEETPIQAEVVDSLDGNSTTNAPSVHAVNDRNTYSTTEKIIGKWIDGRNIYRKTFSISNVVAGANNIYQHGISNLDFIVNYYGHFNNVLGGAIRKANFPNVVPDGIATYGAGISDYSSSYLRLNIGTSFVNITNFTLTLEYIKTAD